MPVFPFLSQHMKIVRTSTPTAQQRETILRLWNAEYPAQLAYEDITSLDDYLNKLSNPHHYFAEDERGAIGGWAFVCSAMVSGGSPLSLTARYSGKV